MPDYTAAIEAYCDGVLDGSIVAGRAQRLAVLRHRQDLRSAGARGYYFSPAAANWAIWLIEHCCVHTKNSIGSRAGEKITLTAVQRFVVWCLWGWRKKGSGYRRFQKAMLEVARKFGKSTFAACLLLLLLVGDLPPEPSGELYCAATKEKQARIVFNEARAIVRKSAALRGRVKCTQNALINERLGSTMQPLGSDSDSTDGLNPSALVKDELHAWRSRHRGLHEKLETGDGARMQPLSVTITTAGDDRAEIWKEERAWSMRVLESVITGEIVDDSLFVMICCIDMEEHTCPICHGSSRRGRRKCKACDGGTVPADDPFDPSCWAKANPNLGQSVGIDKYEKHAQRAARDPTYKNTFLRYYCNVMTTSSEKAIPADLWSVCSGKPYVRPGQFCRGAFDLGRADDFAAWALAFPSIVEKLDEETGQPLRTYDLITRSYTCEARAETLPGGMFQDWIERGLLIVHPGDQIDFDDIERDIVDVSQQYSVLSWGYDATFAIQMAQRLINLYGIPCQKFAQNEAWYNPGCRELMRALRRKDVSHGGDPCLAWQADNLILRRDARDLWMPDKAGSPFKIDAIVSVLMAISDILHHAASDESRLSVYETRGIRSI